MKREHTKTPTETSTKTSSGEAARAAPEAFAAHFKEPKEDVLGQLSAAEFAVLEAEARARLIAEIGEPIRTLARAGRAVSDVKRMMRKMIRESTGA